MRGPVMVPAPAAHEGESEPGLAAGGVEPEGLAQRGFGPGRVPVFQRMPQDQGSFGSSRTASRA